MFGSQAASAMGICSAKADEILWNTMYEKLSARPIPNDSPMPPFAFREESETPMIVRMNAAKDIAIRLWYSISKLLVLAKPFFFCLSMYSPSSGVVIVSCSPSEIRKSPGSMRRRVSSGSLLLSLIISLSSYSSRILQWRAVHTPGLSGLYVIVLDSILIVGVQCFLDIAKLTRRQLIVKNHHINKVVGISQTLDIVVDLL